MSPRPGQTLQLSPRDVAFSCPFCDGHVQTVTPDFAVLHTSPPCQRFLDLDVVDFLHACNVALGNLPA